MVELLDRSRILIERLRVEGHLKHEEADALLGTLGRLTVRALASTPPTEIEDIITKTLPKLEGAGALAQMFSTIAQDHMATLSPSVVRMQTSLESAVQEPA